MNPHDDTPDKVTKALLFLAACVDQLENVPEDVKSNPRFVSRVQAVKEMLYET